MKPTFHNILWPTDFSPLSLAAADAARELAHRFAARLHVVYVAPILVPDSTIAMETAGDWLVSSADIRGGARRALDRLIRDYFRDERVVTRDVRIGIPWQEICEYARSHAIDMIVMSTHGCGGLKHALLGSVAERVAQHSSCPVLIVKDRKLASAD